MHTHLGNDGKTMRACHSIADKHEGYPNEQRYHMMALQDEKVYSKGQDKGEKKPKRTKTESIQYAKDTARIRQFIKQLFGGKKTMMFFPVSIMLSVLDLKKNIDSYRNSLKTIHDEKTKRRIAEIFKEDFENGFSEENFEKNYTDVIGNLSKLTPEPDEDGIINITEDDISDILEKVGDDYANAFINLGKRKEAMMGRYEGNDELVRQAIIYTKEYAVWKAYDDFFKKCESNAKKVLARLEAEKRKKKKKGEESDEPDEDSEEAEDSIDPQKAVEKLEEASRKAREKAKAKGKSPESDPMFG